MPENKLKAVLVPQLVELSDRNRDELTFIELCGGAAGQCFCAEDSFDANKKRLMGCIKRGHTSVLEHTAITIKVRTDRGTSHALVRHRHCAFTQESTIYTKYSRFEELQFIAMPTYDCYKQGYSLPEDYNSGLLEYCQKATEEYSRLLNAGLPAGIARDVLPNCTATTLYITTNFRELQSILNIRRQPSDSVRMHQLIAMLTAELKNKYPLLTGAILGEW
jgi:thymidylate synthase (FAD)